MARQIFFFFGPLLKKFAHHWYTLYEYWSGTPQLLRRLRYWLDDREMLRFPTGESEFSFLQSVQTNPGTKPITYSTDRGSYFPGLKWQILEADHLLPSSAEVKNAWHLTSIFPHAFTAREWTSFFTCIYIINQKKQQRSLSDAVQKTTTELLLLPFPSIF